MSSATPRRRPSRAVYRRRRTVLVIALLAVAAVVWLLVAQPWRGAAETPPAPDPASAPASSTPTTPRQAETPVVGTGSTSAPTTPPADPAPVACTAPAVVVEAVASRSSYGSDANPELSIRLTNNGPAACTLNVGTTAQTFTVTSGQDIWWRSTDCQKEPADMVVTLAAAQSVTSAEPLVWDRTRSSVSTCDSPDRQRAPANGASYHLTVQVGGISSAQSAQFLLN